MHDFNYLCNCLSEMILESEDDIDTVYDKFFSAWSDDFEPDFLRRVWEDVMLQMIELN